MLSKEQLRFNRLVADELAQIIYDGLWFSALSRDLRTYALSSQRVVSGEVRMRLDHGSASVVGRRSPLSLYDKNLATYDEGDAFDHASAVGFIEIFGLPLRVEAARHGAVGKHHGAAWTWTEPLLADLPTTRRRGRARSAGRADPAIAGSRPPRARRRSASSRRRGARGVRRQRPASEASGSREPIDGAPAPRDVTRALGRRATRPADPCSAMRRPAVSRRPDGALAPDRAGKRHGGVELSARGAGR